MHFSKSRQGRKRAIANAPRFNRIEFVPILFYKELL